MQFVKERSISGTPWDSFLSNKIERLINKKHFYLKR